MPRPARQVGLVRKVAVGSFAMTDTHADIPSVVERTQPVQVDGAVVDVCFIGEGAAFVLGEEALVLAGKDEVRRIALHGGAILSSAGDADRIGTGGDDGKVIATDANGAATVIASDAK